MELLLKLFVVAVVVSLLMLLLKKYQPEFTFGISVLAIILILFLGSDTVGSVLRLFRTIAEQTGMRSELFAPLMKVLAIAILTKISVDLCKESGCLSMAGGIELIGNAVAIIAAAPLILSMLSFLMSI